MRSTHLLQPYSQKQITAALSIGDAELQGICKDASKARGHKSFAAGLGIKLHIHVPTDATAAICICHRRGLGRIRHLAVADLWVQERVRC